MRRPLIMFTSALLAVLLLGACAPAPTPTRPPAPTQEPTATRTAASKPAAPTGSSPKANGATFETKSNEGGSVTVDVKPTALSVGEPVEFDIAMNTHSVDLSDDLTKIAILRDDSGKEYRPTAWEGPAGGGHHREGALMFPTLTNKPKYVELVIHGLAKVPERVFKWELP